jgi:hypothetical protein
MTTQKIARSPRCTKWTGETLYDFFNMMSELRDEKYEQRFINAEHAVARAENAYDRRFENVNEFRAALADQQRLLVNRGEYEVAHKMLMDKVESAMMRLEKHEGSVRGSRDMLGWMAGAFGLILTVITIIFMIIEKSK